MARTFRLGDVGTMLIRFWMRWKHSFRIVLALHKKQPGTCGKPNALGKVDRTLSNWNLTDGLDLTLLLLCFGSKVFGVFATARTLKLGQL